MSESVIRRGRQRHPVRFVVLLIASILFVIPFLALAVKALTPGSELDLDAWFPTHWAWSNIPDALEQIPYARFTVISTFIAVIYSGLTSLSSAFVGYAFARFRGPGRRVLFAVLIGVMIVPQIVTLIPTYLLFSQFGLVGTYWPWVLWGIQGAPYAIFLYRQYYSSFPRELEEAARLDGAGRFRTFVSVFLPLSKPLLVTSFVISFNATWGDYVAPNLFLDQDNTTLAVGIAAGYVNDHGFQLTQLLAAGSFIYLLPVIILFLAVQRYYVRGFVSSGLK